jgi:hypothetical protein
MKQLETKNIRQDVPEKLKEEFFPGRQGPFPSIGR